MPSNVAQAAARAADEDQEPRAVRRAIALSAVVVVIGVIAVVLPWPLQRPLWIKAEIVFAVWWSVWAVMLSGMLYRGVSLRHQPTYAAEMSNERQAAGWSGIDIFGIDGASDAVAMVAALILVVVVALVLWLVVEVIGPLLVPICYAVVWWMLARVLRSSELCKGKLGRSAMRGLVWASAYTLPLAIGVALLHVLI